MKTSNEFQAIVYGYWARRFGCEPADFTRPGTLVLKEDDLAGSGKIHLYHIDRMSIVRIDPCLAEQARLPGGYDRDAGSLTIDTFQSALPVEYQTTFLDYFLDAGDFKPFTAGDRFTTRRLDPENDHPHLLRLYQACTAEELDLAAIDVEVPDPVIYGMFAGEQLAAYASHRYWEDVMADIGVLIHPEYRGQGLGKAVVSALCAWCLENDVIPMYRVFTDNVHSCRIAEALGFKKIVVIETLQAVNAESRGAG